VIADLIEGFHHFRPVDVAFTKADFKPGTFALGICNLPAVLLDVNLGDSLPKDPYPLFRPSVCKDIPAIEIESDNRCPELIDIICRFDRAQKEVVPDILNCDLHVELFCQGNSLFDLFRRSAPAFIIADGVINPTRDKQDRIAAECFGIFE